MRILTEEHQYEAGLVKEAACLLSDAVQTLSINH